MLKNAHRKGMDAPQPSSVLVSGAASNVASASRSRIPWLIGWTLRNLSVFVIGAGAIIAAEMLFSEDNKPSTLVGTTIGKTERATLLAQIDAAEARAAAQANGAVRAQQLVAEYQAKNERITRGCQTLFQQYEILNRAAIESQKEYITRRAELLMKTMEGLIGVTSMNDRLSGLAKISPLLGAYIGLLGVDADETQNKATAAGVRDGIMKQFDQEVANSITISMENLKRWQPGIGVMAKFDNLGIPSDCVGRPEIAPPTTVASSPRPSQPAVPVSTSGSQAYQDGTTARHQWEAWLAGLTDAKERGAKWWASVRSDKGVRHSCTEGEGKNSADYRWGCTEAQKYLAVVDKRRLSEPDFREGFKVN